MVVIMMCLTAFAFGAPQTESASATARFADADLVNPSGFPIVNEKVTLSLFAQRGEQYAEMTGWDWLEEKTNVHIEFEIVPQSAYWEKAKIKMATNDMNDIMDLGEKVATRKFADEGFFYPLNDLIDTYGTATKEWVNARPNIWEYQTGADGQYYGWPWTTAESLLSLHRHFLWVEKNWLERVGLDAPTTTDEFYEMLLAFKNEDANGNGDPNDEIPFSSCTARLSNDSSSPLLMPWLSAYYWLAIDNGSVYSPLEMDSFKGAISWQAKLFEEDLMYEESLTQDRATQWKVNEQSLDYNTIGSYIGQHQNYGMSWASEKWKDYIALEPLEGPDGVKFGVWSAPTGRIDIVIDAETEYPATAFRWLDWLYTEEGQLFRRHGLEDVHWAKAIPGALDLAGNQAKWTSITEKEVLDAFRIDSFIQSDWGGIGGTGDKFSISLNPDELTSDGRTKNQVRFQAAQIMNQYVQPLDEQWVNPPVPDSITEEYSIIKTNVLDVVKQYTAMFIVGQKKINSEWDDFQSELKKAGLDRYVELSQIAYDEFAGK